MTVYLNHAGTSWPKPAPVREAALAALAADPGDWARDFDEAHEAVAGFFGVTDRDQLLLTPGCTSALAAAVQDLPWRAGDRALTSGMEHHALHRPLLGLAERGVSLTVVPRAADGPLDLVALARELERGDVRLVALSGAANATGERLPIEEATALAHANGALILVDAAQLAGWSPIDVRALDVDLLAVGGHKALQGLWGVGGLYVASRVHMRPPLGLRPGYCDTGSVDRVALHALHAAIRWVMAPAREARMERALGQIARIDEVLRAHDDVTVLGAGPRVPTVAFTVTGRTPAEVAAALAARGVVASGGHQCAPLAHESLGTGSAGAVRVSAGPTTSDEDVERALGALEAVLA